MKQIVFLDGQYVEKSKAKITVFDHGLLYGDGVFEGIRLYNGCIFKLHEHIERLFLSARYIMLNIPMTREDLIEATAETVRRNGLYESGYIRLVVTRGEGTLGLAPWLCPKPSVFIIATTIKLYPDEVYEKGLMLVTAATTRNRVETVNPRIKSLNYLNNILARIEAHNAGAEEALMLDHNGYVIECTADNIFIVRGKKIVTVPVYMGALKGITRDCIMDLARNRGLEVAEEPFTRFEIVAADECFLTGTAAEAVPVTRLDGRVIGSGEPGPVTKELIGAFREITSSDGVRIDGQKGSGRKGSKKR